MVLVSETVFQITVMLLQHRIFHIQINLGPQNVHLRLFIF